MPDDSGPSPFFRDTLAPLYEAMMFPLATRLPQAQRTPSPITEADIEACLAARQFEDLP